MKRTLTNSVAILVGILVLCTVPARAQIVSYLDSTGKRVFINADPTPVAAPAKTPPAKVPGFKLMALRTSPQTVPASAVISAAEKANRQKIDQMIHEVSDRYRVDPALVRAVIEAESHYQPQAISRRGAQGLMQLVPETAQQMGVANAFDPKQNLDGGVRYLHSLLQRYNGDLDKALAAYNAGPGTVDRAGGVPRIRETREYVRKVTNSYYRPDSDRQSRVYEAQEPIYRQVKADGRVVFTNE